MIDVPTTYRARPPRPAPASTTRYLSNFDLSLHRIGSPPQRAEVCCQLRGEMTGEMIALQENI
jgi:hypothetical protein